MKSLLFKTSAGYAPLIVRLMLGLVIFPHGAQKLLGWFGGYGFEGTMGYLTGPAGLPWIVAFGVILLESVGAVALILGFATRIIAASYALLATGIIITTHAQHGFFMNWFGAQEGEGYEYFLLWIGMALSLVISGAGSYSVDRKIES